MREGWNIKNLLLSTEKWLYNPKQTCFHSFSQLLIEKGCVAYDAYSPAADQKKYEYFRSCEKIIHKFPTLNFAHHTSLTHGVLVTRQRRRRKTPSMTVHSVLFCIPSFVLSLFQHPLLSFPFYVCMYAAHERYIESIER